MTPNEDTLNEVPPAAPVESTPETVTQQSEVATFQAAGPYLMWGLYAASFAVPVLLYIAAVVVAYIKKGEATTQEELAHYREGTNLFWVSFLLTMLATVTYPIGIGLIVFVFIFVFNIYKIVRGFLKAAGGKAY